MRFRRPLQKLGERRTVTRFALLPTRTDDGWLVWLEPVAVDQLAVPTTYGLHVGEMSRHYTWITVGKSLALP